MDELDPINSLAVDPMDESIPAALDEGGRKAWTRVVENLKLGGWLRRSDREPLARYCDMVARYWKMSAKVNEEGETIQTPTIALDKDGNPGLMWRRHPLLSELKTLSSEMRHLETQFGMSPSARAALLASNLRRSNQAGLFGDKPLPGEMKPDGQDADPAKFN